MLTRMSRLRFALGFAFTALSWGCSSADFSVAAGAGDTGGGDLDAVADATVDGGGGGDSGVDSTALDGGTIDATIDGGSGEGGTTDAVSVDGTSTDAAIICTSSGGCPPSQVCLITACDATGGTCVHTSTLANYAPACGCDGISYWNALTAASGGIRVKHDGPCDGIGEGVGCGSTCAYKCIHRHATAAGCALSSGQCWRMPDVPDLACPSGGTGVTVANCSDPSKCLRECAAIKDGSISFYPTSCTP